jgi:hypothetical protein
MEVNYQSMVDLSTHGLSQYSYNLIAARHIPSNLYFASWQENYQTQLIFTMDGSYVVKRTVSYMLGARKFFWHSQKNNSSDSTLKEWMICMYDGYNPGNMSSFGCVLQNPEKKMNLQLDEYAFDTTVQYMRYQLQSTS